MPLFKQNKPKKKNSVMELGLDLFFSRFFHLVILRVTDVPPLRHVFISSSVHMCEWEFVWVCVGACIS